MPRAFGRGYQFRILTPSGLKRLFGMMLPGKGVFPFAGSKIVIGAPPPSWVCEKSLCRGRHGHIVQTLRYQLLLPLNADEEEELVLVAVELAGDIGGAADVKARGVVPVVILLASV